MCKIGTLYFKDGFFCRLNEDDTVSLFSVNDDTNPLGRAETFSEIRETQKEYYLDYIRGLETKLQVLKSWFNAEYGNEQRLM